jgi:hypothetical protein
MRPYFLGGEIMARLPPYIFPEDLGFNGRGSMGDISQYT